MTAIFVKIKYGASETWICVPENTLLKTFTNQQNNNVIYCYDEIMVMKRKKEKYTTIEFLATCNICAVTWQCILFTKKYSASTPISACKYPQVYYINRPRTLNRLNATQIGLSLPLLVAFKISAPWACNLICTHMKLAWLLHCNTIPPKQVVLRSALVKWIEAAHWWKPITLI